MRLHLHQTRHVVGDFRATLSYLEGVLRDGGSGLHLFPELYLTGYPLGDLCLQEGFLRGARAQMDALAGAAASLPPRDDVLLLVGGLGFPGGGAGAPVQNVVYGVAPGGRPETLHVKMLLPDYDVFDEHRYFRPGDAPGVVAFQGTTVGLSVCEDMWAPPDAPLDPMALLAARARGGGGRPGLVANLSASPWHAGRGRERLERARAVSRALGAPLAWANRVGGEDGLLFDGSSFVVDGDRVLGSLPAWREGVLSVDLPGPGAGAARTRPARPAAPPPAPRAMARILSPRLDRSARPPRLPEPPADECDAILDALAFGVREYAGKSGFRRLLVAVSGGLDSSLALAVGREALGPGWGIEALFMPAGPTRPESAGLAAELCRNLGAPLLTLPVGDAHLGLRGAFERRMGGPLEGAADENAQSRLRALALYARSNQTGALVLNTSNKSELAVGYSTIHGDSVGALSPLGDLYKTEVRAVARRLNERRGPSVPEGAIARAPSAELREGQRDEDDLPPYRVLDPMLEGILSQGLGAEGLAALGFDPGDAERVLAMHWASEHKRRQFCPVVKVRPRSLGTGRRVPICKAPPGPPEAGGRGAGQEGGARLSR